MQPVGCEAEVNLCRSAKIYCLPFAGASILLFIFLYSLLAGCKNVCFLLLCVDTGGYVLGGVKFSTSQEDQRKVVIGGPSCQTFKIFTFPLKDRGHRRRRVFNMIRGEIGYD